jgi:NAD+ kinase
MQKRAQLRAELLAARENMDKLLRLYDETAAEPSSTTAGPAAAAAAAPAAPAAPSADLPVAESSVPRRHPRHGSSGPFPSHYASARRASLSGADTRQIEELERRLVAMERERNAWRERYQAQALENDIAPLLLPAPTHAQRLGNHTKLIKRPQQASSPLEVKLSDTRLEWAERPRSVLVVMKPGDREVQSVFLQFMHWLHHEQRLSVLVEPSVLQHLAAASVTVSFLSTWSPGERSHLHRVVDFVITLGGDGTILWAANLFPSAVPPILAFAMGSLGFLTPFPIDEHRAATLHFIEKGCQITLRQRLSCRIVRKRLRGAHRAAGDRLSSRTGAFDTPSASPREIDSENDKTREHERDAAVGDGEGDVDESSMTALNEVMVDRGPEGSMVSLDCYCNGVLFTKALADGIIVATPTGSTAYSLSAGGSMVHPDVPAICFTPVCPHSLSFRPLLLPDSSTIRIEVASDSRADACVSVDGRNRQQLRRGDYVEIHQSRYPLPTVCHSDEIRDWFDAVSNVLQWNVRARQKPLEVPVRVVAPPDPSEAPSMSPL